MPRQLYRIYSHEDADGGIAAALFSRFLHSNYAEHGWDFEVTPVNHGSSKGEWSYREIHVPCAILDFTLHPFFLNDRFASRLDLLSRKFAKGIKIPPCYWIDHHPTGSSYSFISTDNVNTYVPHAKVLWDTNATSTPGLFRTHREAIGIPSSLLAKYEHYIDLAEIIDGALYATAEAAHDFDNLAVQIQTLFSISHPVIDRDALYRRLVGLITANPNPEDLIDSDPLFQGVLQYERETHQKQFSAYRRATQKIGNTAFSNFWQGQEFQGMSRFLPYVLYPEVQYAIHLMPRNQGRGVISCGINPWNKPEAAEKHLGNFFARYFNGGGHSFVAGGSVTEDEVKLVDKLIEFLQS